MQCDLFTEPKRLNAIPAERKRELVASVMGICRQQAWIYCRKLSQYRGIPDNPYEDLQSEAYLAACEAVKYWDESRGVRFGTFATWWIKTHLFAHTQNMIECPEWTIGQPENVAFHDEPVDDVSIAEPDEYSSILLRNLDPISREIVRKVVIEELSPEQVAEQIGRAPTVVKLVMRNAAKRLLGVIQRQAGPNLFAVPTVDSPESQQCGY